MAAFETLLKVPAIHAVEVLYDPDDGSIIIAQRFAPHSSRWVVQIPAEADGDVARCLLAADKANRAEAA